MTPLTKETLESTSPTAESSAPRTGAPTAATRLRSEAVSLEIPIKIHGSRVTEVVLGVTPHTEPFEEQTTTIIVFAAGGVVKMSTPVTAGQMMVLTNLKTRQDVICRVLKVRNNPNLQSYVEIEFTRPQPGYWGVFFPSDNSESAPRPVTSVQPLSVESKTKAEAGPDLSRPFAGAPNMPGVVPAKLPLAVLPPSPSAKVPAPAAHVAPQPWPGSAFISIGSQEEVQVAASSTLSKNPRMLESIKENRGVNAPKKSSAAELASASPVPAVPPTAEIPVAELSGSAQSSIELERQLQPIAETPAVNSTRTFDELGAAGSSASPREMFGSTLGVSAAGDLASPTSPRRNWFLIAACAAVAVVVVAGGAKYFSSAPAGSASGNAGTSAPSSPVVEATQNSAQSSASGQVPYSVPAPPANPARSEFAAGENPNMTTGSSARVTGHLDSEPPLRSAPKLNPKTIAHSVNARPVAPKRAGADQNSVEAPTLDAGLGSPGTNGSLAGIVGSSSTLPPPPPGPGRATAMSKEPKLISSVQPVYPRAAIQAMIDGDVVIHAVIDKSGSVSEATVISGPMMLQSSALDAVRRWKYSPPMLSGQPVMAETTVTVKFRR